MARRGLGWSASFSRFRDSELKRVNRVLSQASWSSAFARARTRSPSPSGGLVDPTLGLAIEAAGYDTDFSLLPDDDERPPGPPSPGRWPALRLDGRLLSRVPRACTST